MPNLADPWLWTSALLAVAVVALTVALRRQHAARAGLAASRRDSFERTATELAAAAKGLLGNVSSVTFTSAEAVDHVRATTRTMTHLSHTAMTAVVQAETVMELAAKSERAADDALAAAERDDLTPGDAGAERIRRLEVTIRHLSSALRDSAAAAKHIAQIAQQQEAKFDEVLRAMNGIFLATEKSVRTTEEVAREARSLDELASGLRRAAGG